MSFYLARNKLFLMNYYSGLLREQNLQYIDPTILPIYVSFHYLNSTNLVWYFDNLSMISANHKRLGMVTNNIGLAFHYGIIDGMVKDKVEYTLCKHMNHLKWRNHSSCCFQFTPCIDHELKFNILKKISRTVICAQVQECKASNTILTLWQYSHWYCKIVSEILMKEYDLNVCNNSILN